MRRIESMTSWTDPMADDHTAAARQSAVDQQVAVMHSWRFIHKHRIDEC